MIYWADVGDDGQPSVGRALAELAVALAGGTADGTADGTSDVTLLDEGTGGSHARRDAVEGPPALPAPRRADTRATLPRRR